MNKMTLVFSILTLAILCTVAGAANKQGSALTISVDKELEVFSYKEPNNGAGPFWCSGSTVIIRDGEKVFVSGQETLSQFKPVNNVRWQLYELNNDNWTIVQTDPGRTREPSPIVNFNDGRLFLSANPTLLTNPDIENGPAQPQIFEISTKNPKNPPKYIVPEWKDAPEWNEHSYRSFAADSNNKQMILFNQNAYDRTYWSLMDSKLNNIGSGQLMFPFGKDYEVPQPIRICYPNVFMNNKAVYFFGVSDIVEPVKAWKDYRFKITGIEWDYDFRRLFFTWTPDITKKPFAEWIEVASREKTSGHCSTNDLWVDKNNNVYLMWTERSLDTQLRAEFFPNEKLTNTLNYMIMKNGKVLEKHSILEWNEDTGGLSPNYARFQILKDGRIIAVYKCSETYPASITNHSKTAGMAGLYAVEIIPGKGLGTPVKIPVKNNYSGTFMTASPRAGNKPSNTLDFLGTMSGNRIGYVHITFK